MGQEKILTRDRKTKSPSCELCGYQFNGKNKIRDRLHHFYYQHFKEKINQEIGIPQYPPFSCPWKDCEYNSPKIRLNLVIHCFNRHKILDKYLEEELKNIQDSSRNTNDFTTGK